MRHLTLHIGNHKTGTTAIQTWMAANRAGLRRQGILDLHVNDQAHVHGHIGFCDDDQIFPKGFCLRDPQAFAAELAALPTPRVIASAENFGFFVRAEPIQDLARALRPHFPQIRILCYLRRQDRQANSHHIEGSRPDRRPEWQLWGQGLGPLPEPSPMHRLYLDYDARLGLWEEAFGRDALQVRIYEPARLIGGSVVRDFIEATGIDPTGLTPPHRSNASPDRVTARIGQILNLMSEDMALLERVTRPNGERGAPARPSRDEARAFLAPYRASNRALNARLGLTAHPDLFDEDFDDLPEAPQVTWTDEEVNRIVLTLGAALLTEVKALQDRQIGPDDLWAAARALQPSHPQRSLRLIEAMLDQKPRHKGALQMQAELRAQLAAD